MEKQTRISKYKDLRNEMKEEVKINRNQNQPEEDIEDDFLAFIPQKTNINIDDTLIEPLTYETLNEESEEVKSAIKGARSSIGKEEYNTRLDILYKIRQEDKPVKKEEVKDEINEEAKKKMSLIERLAAISPEEDVEELKKFEEEKEEKEVKEKEVKEKEERTIKKEVIEDLIDEKDEESNEESEGKLYTFLNFVIIFFIIVFVILVGLIVKQVLF